MTTLPKFDILAVGHLACRLRCGVHVLVRAAEQAGIEPAVRINDVPYFRASDVELLEERVRELQAGRTTDAD